MERWFSILKIALKSEWRVTYLSRWNFVMSFVAKTVTVGTIYYTARVFVPKEEYFAATGGNYFDYVICGLFLTAIPLSLATDFAVAVRRSIADGTLESLMTVPMRSENIAFVLGFPFFIIESFQSSLLYVIAAVVFGFSVHTGGIPAALLVVLASAPIFMAFGLMTTALIVRFGRGDNLFNTVFSIGMILSGVYFPVSALPQWLQAISNSLFTPFQFVLAYGRPALGGAPLPSDIASVSLKVFILGLVVLVISYFVLGFAFSQHRRRAKPVILLR